MKFLLNNFLLFVSLVFAFFINSIEKWRALLSDYKYRLSLLFGLFIFSLSYALTVFVSVRNDLNNYSAVGDLFLDIFPTYNLEFLFTYGIYSLVITIVLYLLFKRPELLPFALKTYGLLFIFRSAFVSLTHFGPPAGFYYQEIGNIGEGLFSKLIFKNDLFFSGHTAIPFMAFLLFRNSYFRWVHLVGSIVMGITVLLMHVHYSIDVFSAYFITYGIYSLSLKLFNGLNISFMLNIRENSTKSFLELFNESRRPKTSIDEIKVKSKIS